MTMSENGKSTEELELIQADAAVKAATLIEALPWLKLFHEQIIVVKFGGNAMVS
jgi:acetylglutamate kinase